MIAPAPTTVVAPGAVAPVVTVPAAPSSATPAGAQATKTASGTLATLPNNSVSIVIDGAQHFQFGNSLYRPVVQGSAIAYQQVR